MSGFSREVDENCALLGCYATGSGNFLPGRLIGTIFKSKKSTVSNSQFLKMGQIDCNSPEERSS